MCSMCVNERILFIYVTHRQIHIYQYVQSHNVSVSAATFIRVTYNNNTIDVQIVYKMCDKTNQYYS